MKPHAKTALALALAIVGGIAAGMRCDVSEWVENSSQTNPRPAAYTVKAYTVADPFIPMVKWCAMETRRKEKDGTYAADVGAKGIVRSVASAASAGDGGFSTEQGKEKRR